MLRRWLANSSEIFAADFQHQLRGALCPHDGAEAVQC